MLSLPVKTQRKVESCFYDIVLQSYYFKWMSRFVILVVPKGLSDIHQNCCEDVKIAETVPDFIKKKTYKAFFWAAIDSHVEVK